MGSLQDHNEPLAWCHLQYNEDGTYFADCLQHYPDSYGNTPLYAAPQPAKREPLTEDQIDLIGFRAVGKVDCQTLKHLVPYGAEIQPLVREIARAIERAHGIGGNG